VDRESTYPGRYRVIPENGNPYHLILERDDEPVTPGTPLNAETFNGMRDEIDAELAKKAPAEFGLGEKFGKRCSDCDTAKTVGFYYVNADTLNNPTSADAVLLVEAVDTMDGVVVYQTLKFGDYALTRYYSPLSAAWKPWIRNMTAVLYESDYGTSLPAAGTKGRIFFKKVSV
jgi:hypothetical protein